MQHRRTLIAMAAALALPAAQAFDFDSGDPDTRIRLDFTAKYSLGYRVKNPSSALTAFNPGVDPGTINEDDGDKNFRKGLISNRVDLLSEFDVATTYGGLRISGTGFYDRVYRRANDNDGNPPANNEPGQAANAFLPATRTQHGADAQLLDAFAYLKGDLGAGVAGTVRLGKHTLQYGESLFFGQNGIANAQGPVDIAKILSVPGWQFKEVLLPVEQVSTSVQLRPGLSVGGYYQFKWRPSRIPGVGSYFSNQDYVGTGVTYLGPQVLVHDGDHDITPKNSGQGGLQARWTPAGSEFEFGFYAARYHDKTPSAIVFDVVNSRVNTAYAQGINTFGASVTSSQGQLNWAVEASIRTNTPLNSDPAIVAGVPCQNSGSETCYAVGKTAHINVSGIYVLQASPLWGGGVMLAELAWNRALSTTHGPASTLAAGGTVDPNTTRDAFAMRALFAPTYFQVLSQLDLTVPIALGYNFGGRSRAIGNFAGGASKAGDISLGLQAKYEQVWTAQLNFTHYLGTAATFTQTLVPGAGAPRQLSFGQTLKDRDYVALSVQRTF
ncbi:MAG: DUF1302 family protein [Burkholderiaceae bacterium]